MPKFDFQCEKCQHVFEAMIPFGSKKFPKCQRCGGPVLKQITAPLGIHFKGSGFYKTDSTKIKEPPKNPPSQEPTEPKKSKEESPKSKKSENGQTNKKDV